VVKTLREAGLKPAGIELDAGSGAVPFISLENGKKAGDWARTQRPLMPLAAAAGALALIAAGTPFIAQQWQLASVDAALGALSATARDAAALRQSTDRLASTAAFLDQERARNGSALAAFAALTQALPDETYLNGATLRDGKLTFTGLSPSAAQLLG